MSIWNRLLLDERTEQLTMINRYWRFLDSNNLDDVEQMNARSFAELKKIMVALGVSIQQAENDYAWLKNLREYERLAPQYESRRDKEVRCQADCEAYHQETQRIIKERQGKLQSMFDARDAAKQERHMAVVAKSALRKAAIEKPDAIKALSIVGANIDENEQ